MIEHACNRIIDRAAEALPLRGKIDERHRLDAGKLIHRRFPNRRPRRKHGFTTPIQRPSS
jgi:hypothetical protein